MNIHFRNLKKELFWYGSIQFDWKISPGVPHAIRWCTTWLLKYPDARLQEYCISVFYFGFIIYEADSMKQGILLK